MTFPFAAVSFLFITKKDGTIVAILIKRLLFVAFIP